MNYKNHIFDRFKGWLSLLLLTCLPMVGWGISVGGFGNLNSNKIYMDTTLHPGDIGGGALVAVGVQFFVQGNFAVPTGLCYPMQSKGDNGNYQIRYRIVCPQTADLSLVDSLKIYTIADSAQRGFKITSFSFAQPTTTGITYTFNPQKGIWIIQGIKTANRTADDEMSLTLNVELTDPMTDQEKEYPIRCLLAANTSNAESSETINLFLRSNGQTGYKTKVRLQKCLVPVVQPRTDPKQLKQLTLIDTLLPSGKPVGKFTIYERVDGSFGPGGGKWEIVERPNIDWYFPDVANYMVAIMQLKTLQTIAATDVREQWRNTFRNSVGECTEEAYDTVYTFVKKDYKPFVQLPVGWETPLVTTTHAQFKDENIYSEITYGDPAQAPYVWDMGFSTTIGFQGRHEDRMQLKDSSYYVVVNTERGTADSKKPIDFDDPTVAFYAVPGKYEVQYRYKYWYAKSDSVVSALFIFPHFIRAMKDSVYHIYRTPNYYSDLLVTANDSTVKYNSVKDGFDFNPNNSELRVRVGNPVRMGADTVSVGKKGKITLVGDTIFRYTPIADSAGLDSFQYILYYSSYDPLTVSDARYNMATDTAWAYVYIHSYQLDISHHVDSVDNPPDLPLYNPPSFADKDTLYVDTLNRKVWNTLTIVNRDLRATDTILNLVVRDTLRNGRVVLGDTVLDKSNVRVYLLKSDTTQGHVASGAVREDSVVWILLYEGVDNDSVKVWHDADSVFVLSVDSLLLRTGKDTLQVYYQSQLRMPGLYPHQAHVQILRHPYTGTAADTVVSQKVAGIATWQAMSCDTAWVEYHFKSKFKITTTVDTVLRNNSRLQPYFSAADTTFTHADTSFLKGDTLVFKIKVERLHTFNDADSMQYATDMVITDTLHSLPSRGLMTIAKHSTPYLRSDIVIANDTVLVWTIRQFPTTQMSDSILLYVVLHDTTISNDRASWKDYINIGDTLYNAARLDTCNEVSHRAYFADAAANQDYDTVYLLHNKPHLHPMTDEARVYRTTRRTRDSIEIFVTAGDTIAHYAPLKSKGSIVKVQVCGHPLPSGGDTLSMLGKGIIRTASDTSFWFKPVDDDSVGIDSFKYHIWYKQNPAIADSGWVIVNIANYEMELIRTMTTSDNLLNIHAKDTLYADSLRQPVTNVIYVLNKDHLRTDSVLSFAIYDTIHPTSNFRDTVLNRSHVQVYLWHNGVHVQLMENGADNDSVRITYCQDSVFHIQIDSVPLDYERDTLKIFYKSEVRKKGKYYRAAHVQLLYRQPDAGSPDDSVLLQKVGTPARWDSVRSDTACAGYEFRSRFKLIKEVDTVLRNKHRNLVGYPYFSKQDTTFARGDTAFLKGDTLVYKITVARVPTLNNDDSMQYATGLVVYDTLNNRFLSVAENRPLASIYKTSSPSAVVTETGNNIIIQWTINKLPKTKDTSLWVYVALETTEGTYYDYISQGDKLVNKARLDTCNEIESADYFAAMDSTEVISTVHLLRNKPIIRTRIHTSTLYPVYVDSVGLIPSLTDTIAYALGKNTPSELTRVQLYKHAGWTSNLGGWVEQKDDTTLMYHRPVTKAVYGVDTIMYKISYKLAPNVYDTGYWYVNVRKAVQLNMRHRISNMAPNFNSTPIQFLEGAHRAFADTLQQTLYNEIRIFNEGDIARTNILIIDTLKKYNAASSQSETLLTSDSVEIINDFRIYKVNAQGHKQITNAPTDIQYTLDVDLTPKPVPVAFKLDYFSPTDSLHFNEDTLFIYYPVKTKEEGIYKAKTDVRVYVKKSEGYAYGYVNAEAGDTILMQDGGYSKMTDSVLAILQLGLHTKVNIEADAPGTFRQGATVAYNIRLKQTVGLLPAAHVVVRAALPPALEYVAMESNGVSLPNYMGDTLAVIDTLPFFSNSEFSNYWFETGTPTFLINRLKKHGLDKTVLEPVIADSSAFDSYDPDALDDVPLLFQTGYLTVKNKKMTDGNYLYTLEVPNMEVRESLMRHLLSAYTNYPLSTMSALGRQMLQQILAFDAEGFTNNMRKMLADVPYTLQASKARNKAKAEAENAENEAYYHTIFQVWMTMLGFNIQSEKMTHRGRIDAVLQQDGLAIVVELKYHAKTKLKTLLKQAIAQIYDKRYYEQFLDRKVILLGIAFSGKEVACRIEQLMIK
ncbi:hypothetical protein FACS1894156_1360 [Bacteroidia bacterium]|nr:hypothetical protein FACS1894156_1360 [Bacteroidia bacterium]